jgi:hypothetical protein
MARHERHRERSHAVDAHVGQKGSPSQIGVKPTFQLSDFLAHFLDVPTLAFGDFLRRAALNDAVCQFVNVVAAPNLLPLNPVQYGVADGITYPIRIEGESVSRVNLCSLRINPAFDDAVGFILSKCGAQES